MAFVKTPAQRNNQDDAMDTTDANGGGYDLNSGFPVTDLIHQRNFKFHLPL